MTTGDSIEEIREEHARAEAHQDKLLLTITEELKLRLKWKRLNPSTRISWRDYWLGGQIAKALKHRLDRPELREKIAGRFIVLCEDCLHGANLDNDCPHLDEDICMWQRELADEVLALIPDIEALDRLRDRLTELEKKLDDREVDLIEAKKQERERILGILQGEYPPIDTWQCWKTLKGE